MRNYTELRKYNLGMVKNFFDFQLKLTGQAVAHVEYCYRTMQCATQQTVNRITKAGYQNIFFNLPPCHNFKIYQSWR